MPEFLQPAKRPRVTDRRGIFSDFKDIAYFAEAQLIAVPHPQHFAVRILKQRHCLAYEFLQFFLLQYCRRPRLLRNQAASQLN